MSGLEVAGLALGVLGAIPVAIKALQVYKDTLSIKQAERHLACLIRDLETEHVRLQNTCETLLVGIVPPLKIDDMLKVPFGSEWAPYNEPLRLKLWKSSEEFKEHVLEMDKAVRELREKLCIETDGKTRLTDRFAIIRELKQGAVFTIKKNDYKTILSKIKNGNDVLQHLAHLTSRLEPDRRHRSQTRIRMLVRDLCQSIFNALRNALSCKCMKSHNLGLELVPRRRTMHPDDSDDDATKDLKFHVVLGSYSDSAGAEPALKGKQRPDRWDSFRVQLAKPSSEPPHPILPITVTRGKEPRRVRWSSSLRPGVSKERANTATQTAVELSSCPPAFPSSAADSNTRVTDLCQIAHMSQKAIAVDCHGCIVDLERKFNVYSHQHTHGYSETFTLRQVFEEKDPSLQTLGYAERLELALALSVGVLHTYNTPWLAKILTLDGIVLRRDGNGSQQVLYQPFVTTSTLETCVSPEIGSKATPNIERPFNLTVFSLGMLLIQVIIGRVENSLDMAGCLDINAALSKYEAGSKFDNLVSEKGGMNFAAAVEWCLDTVNKVAGLEDDRFCQDFYGAVVARLEEDMTIISAG